MPTSSAKDAKARADKGVSSEGLMTQVHPAAKAAPTFRVIMALGKFLNINKFFITHNMHSKMLTPQTL